MFERNFERKLKASKFISVNPPVTEIYYPRFGFYENVGSKPAISTKRDVLASSSPSWAAYVLYEICRMNMSNSWAKAPFTHIGSAGK